MTERRAFWLALAIVLVPTAAVWGVYVYTASFHWEDMPVFLFFAVLPAVVLLPWLYFRILDGPTEKRKLTRRQHIFHAVFATCLASGYLVFILIYPRARTGRDWFFNLALVFSWYVGAAYHIDGARKGKPISPNATQ